MYEGKIKNRFGVAPEPESPIHLTIKHPLIPSTQRACPNPCPPYPSAPCLAATQVVPGLQPPLPPTLSLPPALCLCLCLCRSFPLYLCRSLPLPFSLGVFAPHTRPASQQGGLRRKFQPEIWSRISVITMCLYAARIYTPYPFETMPGCHTPEQRLPQ